MLIVGVAYYLNPHSPIDSPAWACIEGSAVEKVSHPAAISDVVWFTNLELSAFIEWSLDHENVKRNDFFPGGMAGLIKESGHSLKDVAKNGRGIDVVQRLISNAIKFVSARYSCPNIKLLDRLADVFQDIVRPVMLTKAGSQLYNQAFIGSFRHIYRNQDPSIMGQGERITFKFPKGAYAKHLSQRPVPGNDWKEVEPDGEGALPLIERYASQFTGFARIRAKKSDADALRLIEFGDPTGQWLTLPEAYEIARQIPVKVDLVVIASPAENPLAKAITLTEGHSSITLLTASAGYCLESAWEYITRLKMKRSDNSHNFPAPTACYFRTWDRIACHRASIKLANQGCEVISYGNGQITMLIPENLVDKKMLEAYELGLTVDMSLFKRDRRKSRQKSPAASMVSSR